MKERTKLGLGVLEAALLLGVLGDVLLRATPWGLNVFLWTATLVVAAWALARRRRISLAGEGDWLLPSVLLFSAAFAWRDSLTLRSLDALAILLLLSLAALRMRGGRVRLAGLTDYAAGVAFAGFNAAFGTFPLLMKDISWKEIPRTGATKHVLAVTRGLLIALPLLGIFGALFMAADAIFDGIVRNTIDIETDVVAGHVVLAVVFAWITGGFLRGMLFGAPITPDNRRHTLLKTLRHTLLKALGMTAGIDRVTPDTTAAAATDVAATTATAAMTSNTATGQTATVDTTTGRDVAAGATVGNRNVAQGSDGGAVAHHDASFAASGGARQEGVRNNAFHDERNKEAADERARAAQAESRRAAATNARVGLSLGIVEVGTVLALVNLLFISFVVVQIRYFFGGVEWVVSSTGLTYAEYARRGFFELVWVAALVLPLLLGAHWLLRKDNPAHERIFRILAGVQVALLVVIMVSALRRMRLYQSEYGMTELRLYTTAFMAWLGIVFVWFTATVLRGRRERFACGALAAGLCIVGLLHVLNPDRFIVETNSTLVTPGRLFDAEYVSSLSADAVPTLIDALPEMSIADRGVIAARLLERWSSPEHTDWRTWNWARAEAWRAVESNREMLHQMHRQQWMDVLQTNPKINSAGGDATRIVNPYVTGGAQ